MQGPGSLLNVLTIPPGAIPGQQRIVIDGIRGAIFEYANGAGIGITQPDNPLVSSWASKAGTDPFGNAYPQGFSIGSGSVFEGTDFIIDDMGIFFYSGTPAAGNLIISLVPNVTADQFGNVVQPNGITFYNSGGGFTFVGLNGGESQFVQHTGAAIEGGGFAMDTAVVGSGATSFIATALFGAFVNTALHEDFVLIQINSANSGGTSSANGSLLYNPSGAANPIQQAFWDINGFTIVKGQYNPGDGSTGEDGWHLGHITDVIVGNKLINSTAQQNLGTLVVQAGITYRFHGIIECVQGATASTQFIGLATGPTQVPTRLFFFWTQDAAVGGAGTTFSAISNQGTTGFIASPAYAAGRTFYLYLDAVITPTDTTGILWVAACSVAADTFTIVNSSFLDVWRQ